MIRLVVGRMTLEQSQRAIQPLRHSELPDKLLRQYQTSVMRHLASGIALQMEQRMTHHPSFGLGPRKLFGIYARTRIDVTCALKCDRYFHLGALCFWGYVAVLQLFVYLISEGFSHFKSISKNFLTHSAYLRASSLHPAPCTKAGAKISWANVTKERREWPVMRATSSVVTSPQFSR